MNQSEKAYIILSARGSVSDKVLGLDTGANDYLAKPFDFEELALLEYFLLNSAKVISQEEMMEHVWNMEADNFSNAVRVHIASLRKKLKAAIHYDPIATKIGAGYYLRRGDKSC